MLLLITTIILVGIAMVLLGVRVLFVKGGKFPNGHIHQSKAMRERGITCASSMDSDQNNEKRKH